MFTSEDQEKLPLTRRMMTNQLLVLCVFICAFNPSATDGFKVIFYTLVVKGDCYKKTMN